MPKCDFNKGANNYLGRFYSNDKETKLTDL